MNTPYTIGLGTHFLTRAKIIFLAFLSVFALLLTCAAYAERQTGDLKQKIVKPTEQFFSRIGTRNVSPPLNNTFLHPYEATSSAEINIEVNIETTPAYEQSTQNNPSTYTVTQPTPYQYNTKSYEEALKEQNEWYKSVQEENRKKSEESQKQLEQFRAESQQKMQEFDQQSQSDFLKFQQEGQKQMEEFKKQYGF